MFPCYKVNMDVAVFKSTKSVGIGVIVQLCSTGAFRDSGAGAGVGAGLGNF